MPTTTNYGWTTPADTDLVKDGASAIRTLGSSIDTTTKALNPSTTLGDIEYRSSTANTNTRLAIGTTGQVLTVAGGVPSWATASSGGMTLIGSTSLTSTATTIGSIPSTYYYLYGVVYNRTTSTATDGALRCLPNDATTQSTTGVREANLFTNTVWELSGEANITYNDAENAFEFFIYNYASTTAHKPIAWTGRFNRSGAGKESIIGGGVHTSNTAITSVTLRNRHGQTFNGGTFELYGVK